MTIGVYILLAAALALVTIPAWPAISEWRAGRDKQPLAISDTYAEDHHLNAAEFGRSVSAHLKEALQAFMASGGQPGTAAEVLKDRYDIVGPHSARQPDFQDGDLPLVLVQHQSRVWPANMHLSRQTYVTGAFESGTGSRVDRLFVEGDLYLGEETNVTDWTHASRDIRALAGCRLHGSVQAGRMLQVWPGCHFERLSGDEVRFGDEWHWPEGPLKSRHQPRGLPPLFRLNGRARRMGRSHLVDGDLVIPPEHVWSGDLVVLGKLRLGRGARIEGSVKAESAVLLESGASVDGQLISNESIEIRDSACVTGTAATEGDLHVRWGAEIGSPTSRSTASGRRVLMDQGARVFGVVVAVEFGRVGLRTVARLAA